MGTISLQWALNTIAACLLVALVFIVVLLIAAATSLLVCWCKRRCKLSTIERWMLHGAATAILALDLAFLLWMVSTHVLSKVIV